MELVLPSIFTGLRRASSGCQASTATIFLVPQKLFFKNPDALDKKEQQIFLWWTKGTHHVSAHLAPKALLCIAVSLLFRLSLTLWLVLPVCRKERMNEEIVTDSPEKHGRKEDCKRRGKHLW